MSDQITPRIEPDCSLARIVQARRANLRLTRFPPRSSASLRAVIPKGWSYISPGWSDERDNGRRATLGNEFRWDRKPQRGGPNRRVLSRLGPPLQGFDVNRPPYPGLRDVRLPHVAPPWANIGPPRWGWFVGVASDNTPSAQLQNEQARETAVIPSLVLQASMRGDLGDIDARPYCQARCGE